MIITQGFQTEMHLQAHALIISYSYQYTCTLVHIMLVIISCTQFDTKQEQYAKTLQQIHMWKISYNTQLQNATYFTQ